MKVISGFLKGRVIEGFDIDGTRPTMDRVKESVFAMIQNYISDSIVLDLFAGSGNLGIEAISNGAKEVYFNDLNNIATKTIKKNINNFDIHNAIVYNYNYGIALKKLKECTKFDIIFLDPPYKMDVVNKIIKFIADNDLLNYNGIIVCEVSIDYQIDNYLFNTFKEKKYGDKKVIILKNDCQ